MIFPEGRISLTGKLMQVFDGAAMVAAKAGAKILPVRINGAQYSSLSYVQDKFYTRMFPKIDIHILPSQNFKIPINKNSRTLVANAVEGVSKGFEKKLDIQGVGYRANMEGSNLNLQLGYSHPVVVEPPAGITITVDKNVNISVCGSNKQMVGDVAAAIRSKRPPEVYKGKGIRYEGEYIRRKAGKAGKK